MTGPAGKIGGWILVNEARDPCEGRAGGHRAVAGIRSSCRHRQGGRCHRIGPA